jgi:hypothetical protein
MIDPITGDVIPVDSSSIEIELEEDEEIVMTEPEAVIPAETMTQEGAVNSAALGNITASDFVSNLTDPEFLQNGIIVNTTEGNETWTKEELNHKLNELRA